MWIVASAHERDRYMLVMEEEVLARMDQLMHEKGLAPATVVARLGTREEAMACARQTAAERRERRRRERDEKRNAEHQARVLPSPECSGSPSSFGGEA